ncbi:hypothetical protein HN873_038882 [Arachis hypogaea]
MTNPNPIRAKSLKLFSHHQPPPLSAVTTSDCHPCFSKVLFPPRVVKPKGAIKPEPILLLVARSSSSPNLSSSSSSPRVPPLPPNVSVARCCECLLSSVLLAVANVPVLLTVVPVPPEASFLQQQLTVLLRMNLLEVRYAILQVVTATET